MYRLQYGTGRREVNTSSAGRGKEVAVWGFVHVEVRGVVKCMPFGFVHMFGMCVAIMAKALWSM